MCSERSAQCSARWRLGFPTARPGTGRSGSSSSERYGTSRQPVEGQGYQLAPGIIQTVYKVHDATKPVVFGALRYARDAIDSYRQFAVLKNDGLIAPGTRFQVALPTPLAVTAGFIEATSQELVEKAYEIRLLEELQEILDAVPHRELAVQWDVAYEVVFLEGWSGSAYFDRSRARLLERLAALGDAVPPAVSLGYHLCYGDPGHKHLIEPTDLTLCVEISNSLALDVKRPIDWLHMPVPENRGRTGISNLSRSSPPVRARESFSD